MFVIVELLYGIWGRREWKREWESINSIEIHYICAGRGYKDVY
jgi:hypothetical protein